MAHSLSSPTLHSTRPTSHRAAPEPAAFLPPSRLSLATNRSARQGHASLSSHVRKPTTLPRAVATTESSGNAVGENPPYADSDYIVLGIAQCFVKDESNKLQPVNVIEPIPAGALECMDNGGVTSYTHATGTTLGVALKEDSSLLPEEFRAGRFCDEFVFRTLCASRTWKRQHAQENLLSLLPVGVVRSDFNFNLEDKRVLNMETEVNDDDNIKQDISIDVYGRSKEEEGSTDKEIEKLYNA